MITTRERNFLRLLDAHAESEERQLALLSIAKTYQAVYPSRKLARKSLHRQALPEYKRRLAATGRYGSVLLLFILVTAAGAALSWAVQRMLDWLFPEKDDRLSLTRSHQLIALAQRWST